MAIMDVYEAYGLCSNRALSQALLKFQAQLINNTQRLGPAAVAFQLSKEGPLTPILNRIEADASVNPSTLVAYLAGFIRAYADYLDLIADRQKVDSATALLSTDGEEHNQGNSVRMMILKAAFTHGGTRSKELINVVARLADLNESSVKFHIKKLVNIELLERHEESPKAVSYRISPLGEAVLARRTKPHELALFLIDEASSNLELRDSIEREMRRVWTNDRNEENVASLLGEEIPIVFDDLITHTSPGSKLNEIHLAYQEKRGQLDLEAV